jgi:hypothetical protein
MTPLAFEDAASMASLQAACRQLMGLPLRRVCGKLDKFKLGMGLFLMP